MSTVQWKEAPENAEIRKQVEDQIAAANSPEAISAAVQEFKQRNPQFEENAFTANELARFVRGDVITVDALQQAYDERLAAELSQTAEGRQQLRQYINQRAEVVLP